MDISFFSKLIESYMLKMHTAYIAKVISVNGNYAMVQPLTFSQSSNGELLKQSIVSAFIPKGIKTTVKTIQYMVSGTKTESIDVLVPDELCANDIVYCGVCECDISSAVNGVMAEMPVRNFDMNDSVILKVL